MEVKVDKFGRVLIPKELRDRMGWKAGARLRIQQAGEALLLELEGEAAPLQQRGKLLVFCGDLDGDPDQILKDLREASTPPSGSRPWSRIIPGMRWRRAAPPLLENCWWPAISWPNCSPC